MVPPPAHLLIEWGKDPPPAQTAKMGPRPPLYPPPEHLLSEWWPPPAQTTKMEPRPPLVPPPEHLLIEQLQWWASAPYEPKPEEQSFSIQMRPHDQSFSTSPSRPVLAVDWDPYMVLTI